MSGAALSALGGGLQSLGQSVLSNAMALRQMEDERRWRDWHQRMQEKQYTLREQEMAAEAEARKEQMMLMKNADQRAGQAMSMEQAREQREADQWELAQAQQAALDDWAKAKGAPSFAAWKANHEGEKLSKEMTVLELSLESTKAQAAEANLRQQVLKGQMTQQEADRRLALLEAAGSLDVPIETMQRFSRGDQSPEVMAEISSGMQRARVEPVMKTLASNPATAPLAIRARQDPSYLSSPEFQKDINAIQDRLSPADYMAIASGVNDLTTNNFTGDRVPLDPVVAPLVKKSLEGAGLDVAPLDAAAPAQVAPPQVYEGREAERARVSAERAATAPTPYRMNGLVALAPRKDIPQGAELLDGDYGQFALNRLQSIGKDRSAREDAIRKEYEQQMAAMNSAWGGSQSPMFPVLRDLFGLNK
jgi:hypothetical protein